MAITVNAETCIGCGACVSLCPKTFAMNAEGKSEPTSQDDLPCAMNAVDTCPVQAIKAD